MKGQTMDTYEVHAMVTNPAIDDGVPHTVLYYSGPSLPIALARMSEAATNYVDENASKGNGENVTHSVTLTVKEG